MMLQIRAARENDLESLNELMFQLHDHHHQAQPELFKTAQEIEQEKSIDRYLEHPECLVFVAEKDAEIIGFITAIANPKGWAFMISLLPPFINIDKSVSHQMIVLIGIILCTEFISMLAYATGGKSLRLFLSKGNNVRFLNRIAGTLMIAVGIWLAMID